jgi:hypothetical protein
MDAAQTAQEHVFVPPHTPVLTEVVRDTKGQQVKVQEPQQQARTPAKMPKLSIREATARAIEQHLEKVLRTLLQHLFSTR